MNRKIRFQFIKIIAITFTLAFVQIFTACGANTGTDTSTATTEATSVNAPVEASTETGWEYFESINTIWLTYDEVSERYSSMENIGFADGGLAFRLNGLELYAGFPVLSEEEITGSEACTAMYGTVEELFNIHEWTDIETMEEDMGVNFEPSDEYGMYTQMHSSSGDYHVIIMTEDSSFAPDTSVTICRVSYE